MPHQYVHNGQTKLNILIKRSVSTVSKNVRKNELGSIFI